MFVGITAQEYPLLFFDVWFARSLGFFLFTDRGFGQVRAGADRKGSSRSHAVWLIRYLLYQNVDVTVFLPCD